MALVLDKRLILCCCAFSIISVANAATVNGTFQVLMTIQKACTVTAGSASNITLGPVNTTATNTSGNNTISVNCSKTTPYFIGLAPSTANGGNALGAGAMSSVANSATNTDKVPYQLNQTSATGPVWGNTATTTEPETALRQPELGWRRLLPFMPPHRTPTSRLTTMPTR